MAVNKDSGDTRTYTADKLEIIDWKVPASPSSNVSVLELDNWPGLILSEPYTVLWNYHCTYYNSNGATLQSSNASGSGWGDVAEGHAGGTFLTHPVIPGFHMAKGNISNLQDGDCYLRVTTPGVDTSDATLTSKQV